MSTLMSYMIHHKRASYVQKYIFENTRFIVYIVLVLIQAQHIQLCIKRQNIANFSIEAKYSIIWVILYILKSEQQNGMPQFNLHTYMYSNQTFAHIDIEEHP
jgi:hypothetical protein